MKNATLENMTVIVSMAVADTFAMFLADNGMAVKSVSALPMFEIAFCVSCLESDNWSDTEYMTNWLTENCKPVDWRTER